MNRLLLSLAMLLTTLTVNAQNPQVKTSEGVLEGIEESGIKVFKGVPFAQPPVGDLRWKAPQPVKAWTGVRKAHDFGPNPMQQPLFGDISGVFRFLCSSRNRANLCRADHSLAFSSLIFSTFICAEKGVAAIQTHPRLTYSRYNSLTPCFTVP